MAATEPELIRQWQPASTFSSTERFWKRRIVWKVRAMPRNINKENIRPTRRRIPPDFSLNNKLIEIAGKHGLNCDRINTVFEHFKAHHESRGTTMLDWNKAWLTWVINDKKFNASKLQKIPDVTASYTPPDRIQKILQPEIEREKYLRGEK